MLLIFIVMGYFLSNQNVEKEELKVGFSIQVKGLECDPFYLYCKSEPSFLTKIFYNVYSNRQTRKVSVNKNQNIATDVVMRNENIPCGYTL